MSKRGNPFYDMPRAKGVPPRWTATVYYRTDAGLVDVEHLNRSGFVGGSNS